MTDYIQEHEQALLVAFAEVIRAEDKIAKANAAIEQVQQEQAATIREGESLLQESWDRIAALLNESGEVSVTLPGAVTDYEIYRTSPRESVKVVDPTAVPEAFCKVERKPKLKDIGDYLRAQARASLSLPNWAALELGETKLAWRAKKKHATT
jgi:hypothetical protein